jgi:hypothetical protein
MDFQYDNPLKADHNSPFRLTNLGKTLNFESDSNNLKRGHSDPPSSMNAFTFNTPRTIPHTKNIFTPGLASLDYTTKQDTPGTDNTDELTDDLHSDPDSPIAVQSRLRRNKLSDLAKLKIKRRRQKHARDIRQQDDTEHLGKEKNLVPQPWSLDQHRDLPYIASGYLQLGFNLFLISIILYFLVSFITTIQADVNKKVEEYSAEILSEISVCSKDYLENRCSPDQRVPAMQLACQAWERCMERDPAKVGRARVSAETFAEIVNSLIEPISYKTMIFCLALIFGSLFVSNFAFGLLRQKQYSSHQSTGHHNLPQPATFMIQATPQHNQRS